MAYEFRIGDDPGKGLKRIARQQLRRLAEQLRDRADQANGHHEARKCIKRLRALMILARPAIGKAKWSGIDGRHAKVARRLSTARDTTVLLQTLDRLQKQHGAPALAGPGARLREALRSEIARPETEKLLADIVDKLDRLASRIKGMKLAHADFAPAWSGLEGDYRGARQALRQAYGDGKPDDFHLLRKHVQRHWRHMQLFATAWPAEMVARIALAKALSELLGEDHDLTMLRLRLKDDGGAKALDRLCRERQMQLRATASGGLALLLAERPKALRRRLNVYWRAAVAAGKKRDDKALGIDGGN